MIYRNKIALWKSKSLHHDNWCLLYGIPNSSRLFPEILGWTEFHDESISFSSIGAWKLNSLCANMDTESLNPSLYSGWKKIPMAAVWLYDGSIMGQVCWKIELIFFSFFFIIIGIHTFPIHTIIIYNTFVTDFTNITYDTTATLLT